MPGFDRTGPLGQGAGSGRGLGPCTGNHAQGKPGCRRKGGSGLQRGMRSRIGLGQGQGNQMMNRFGTREELIPENDNFGKSGGIRRRNRIWAK